MNMKAADFLSHRGEIAELRIVRQRGDEWLIEATMQSGDCRKLVGQDGRRLLFSGAGSAFEALRSMGFSSARVFF